MLVHGVYFVMVGFVFMLAMRLRSSRFVIVNLFMCLHFDCCLFNSVLNVHMDSRLGLLIGVICLIVSCISV